MIFGDSQLASQAGSVALGFDSRDEVEYQGQNQNR